MTDINDIIAALVVKEYIVNTKAQEKQLLSKDEVVIVVDEIKIAVETTKTYIMTSSYTIMWNEKDTLDIAPSIKTIIEDIENNVSPLPSNFKFTTPTIELLGVAYNVKMKLEYDEVITIGS